MGYGYLTRDWETSILRFLKVSGTSLGQVGFDNGFDGHTESWLEASFPVTTLKELMNLVDDFEDINSKAGNQWKRFSLNLMRLLTFLEAEVSLGETGGCRTCKFGTSFDYPIINFYKTKEKFSTSI